MTATPEAALAREMGRPYPGMTLAVNSGLDLARGEVVLEDIESAAEQDLACMKAILLESMASAA